MVQKKGLQCVPAYVGWLKSTVWNLNIPNGKSLKIKVENFHIETCRAAIFICRYFNESYAHEVADRMMDEM